MRQLLLSSCPVMLWVITAAHLCMLLLAFRRYGRTKEPLYLLSALVILGLFYDALILSLGTVLKVGAHLRRSAASASCSTGR